MVLKNSLSITTQIYNNQEKWNKVHLKGKLSASTTVQSVAFNQCLFHMFMSDSDITSTCMIILVCTSNFLDVIAVYDRSPEKLLSIA